MAIALWGLYALTALVMAALGDYFSRDTEMLSSIYHPKLAALFNEQARRALPFYAVFWLMVFAGAICLIPLPDRVDLDPGRSEIIRSVFLFIFWCGLSFRAAVAVFALGLLLYYLATRSDRPPAS